VCPGVVVAGRDCPARATILANPTARSTDNYEKLRFLGRQVTNRLSTSKQSSRLARAERLEFSFDFATGWILFRAKNERHCSPKAHKSLTNGRN
jgi:hypothetical protein